MRRHNFHLPYASMLLCCITLLCLHCPLVPWFSSRVHDEKPLTQRVIRDFYSPTCCNRLQYEALLMFLFHFYPKPRDDGVNNNGGKRPAQLFVPLLIFSTLMLIFAVCLHHYSDRPPPFFSRVSYYAEF